VRAKHSLEQCQSKIRMTLLIEEPVASQLRKAVFDTETRYTISEIANESMKRSAQLLERLYNGGEQFPKRRHALTGGRPPILNGGSSKRAVATPMTVYVEREVAERFRDAVYYTPTHETITRVISKALGHAARILNRKRMTAERKRKLGETRKVSEDLL